MNALLRGWGGGKGLSGRTTSGVTFFSASLTLRYNKQMREHNNTSKLFNGLFILLRAKV